MNDEQIISLYRSGGPANQRFQCPQCPPKKGKPKNFTISYDEKGYVWNCFSCNFSGSKLSTADYRPLRAKEGTVTVRATPIALDPMEATAELPEASAAYLYARGISAQTAKAAGIWAKDSPQGEFLCFPYHDDRMQVTAFKARGISEKKFFMKGVCETYFLQPQILSDDVLIITEGEIDALSIMEAGFKDVMSVPTGAPQRVNEGKVDAHEDGKFRFVWGAKNLYEKAKKIILFTDSDIPGKALAEELARRIGKGRCWSVALPDDCKDANDVLVKHGVDKLKEIINSPVPWPIQGVYDASHYELKVKNLFKSGPGKGMSTGFSNVDDFYTIVPGHLTVVTGVPGSGKTAFLNQLMVNLAQSLDWKFAIQSTEIEPPVHIAMLCAIYKGLSFFDFPEAHNSRMNETDLDEAMRWVNDHFTFLESDGPADVRGTIERLELAVMRYGSRGICIDPASYLRGKSGDGMDNDQVGHMLEEFKNFATQYECAVWLIAHPYKVRMRDDGSSPVPKGYEISGSAHWYNRPDVGLTIHRSADNRSITEAHVWKMRYSWVGKEGRSELFFDPPTGRYTEQPIARPGKIIYSAYGGEPLDKFSLDDFFPGDAKPKAALPW